MRFARIAPLLFLLLTVLSILHIAQFKDFVVSSKTGGLAQALFAALTFHVNVLEAKRGYLPGNWDILWSLSVEEVFFFFFPLVARLFGRGKTLIVLLIGFVALGRFAHAVFTHGNEIWKEYSYLGGMDAIALGCLTALWVSRVRFSRTIFWIFRFARHGALSFLPVLFAASRGLEIRPYRTGYDDPRSRHLHDRCDGCADKMEERACCVSSADLGSAQAVGLPHAYVCRFRPFPTLCASWKADERCTPAVHSRYCCRGSLGRSRCQDSLFGTA